MKATSLVLHSLIVVVGIFVYDRWVRPRPAAVSGGHEDAVPDSSTSASDGAGGITHARLADLATRLARLEARSEARVAAPPPTRLRDPPAQPVGDSPAPPPPPQPLPPVVVEDPEFPPADVARFRALEDAVRRQRGAEAVQRRVALALQAERLYDRERDRVLEEAVRAWTQADKEERRLAEANAPHAERVRAFAAVRAELEAALGRVVDTSRVDRISATVASAIGLPPGAASLDEPGDEEGR